MALLSVNSTEPITVRWANGKTLCVDCEPIGHGTDSYWQVMVNESGHAVVQGSAESQIYLHRLDSVNEEPAVYMEFQDATPKWHYFHVSTTLNETANRLFYAFASATGALNVEDVDLFLGESFPLRNAQRGALTEKPTMSGTSDVSMGLVLVNPKGRAVAAAVHSRRASLDLKIDANWTTFEEREFTEDPVSISVPQAARLYYKVTGPAAGRVVDVKIVDSLDAVTLRIDPNVPAVLNSLHTANTKSSTALLWGDKDTPMWMSLHRRLGAKGTVQVEFKSNSAQVNTLKIGVNSVKLEAGESFFATLNATQGGLELHLEETDSESWDLVTHEVRIAYGAGAFWPNADLNGIRLTDTSTFVKFSKDFYNFRIHNGAGARACEFQVRVVERVQSTGSDGASDAALISGEDALAILVDLVFVAIIFTVLAGFTFRRIASHGRLVVEEEEDENYE